MIGNQLGGVGLKLLTAVLSVCLLAFSTARDCDAEDEPIELIYLGLKQGRVAVTYSNKQESDIYLIDFSNQEVSPLVATKATELNPRWSRDGKLLAYNSDSSGKSGIYVKSLVEPKLKARLIGSFPGAQQPDWSPDDAYLVFSIRNSKNSGRSLVIANAQGKSNTRRLLKSSSSITYPRWSPRGNAILYSSNQSWPGWDLEIIDINTRESKTLTKGIQNFVRGTWHPNGGEILFSYGSGRDFDLWKIDKGSRHAIEEASLPGRVFDAEWIMQGSAILFVAEDFQGSGHYELFLYDSKSKTTERLTRSTGSIRDVSWSPLQMPPLKPKVLVEQEKLDKQRLDEQTETQDRL